MKFKSGANLRLWRALAISLALHGFVLSTAMPPPHLPRPPDALRVSLAGNIGEVPTLIAAPQPRASNPSVGRGAVHTRPRRLEGATPGPAIPAVHASRAVRKEAGTAAPGENVAPVANAPRIFAGADPEPKEMTAAKSPDVDGVRQYRLNLAAAARRFKRYPARALEYGWAGRAEITLAVAASGTAQPPQLLHGSGHEELDRAALEMIERAAAVTALPPMLYGQAFAISLPVLFDLDER